MSNDDIFDFGFTAVTEDELDTVIALQEKADTVLDTHNRLHELYNAVTPLLNSLKANPEKDYIYWPNRLEKVEAFEDKLQGILRG
jgi:hypothetical protein|tara:strand:- start:332 stop:586 length:255 start_codon:yes stop_codon:yes gene_type:complete